MAPRTCSRVPLWVGSDLSISAMIQRHSSVDGSILPENEIAVNTAELSAEYGRARNAARLADRWQSEPLTDVCVVVIGMPIHCGQVQGLRST
jgi:hypothetical protein